jgi:hypothetical protein
MFRPDELDLLICGVPEIHADDLVASSTGCTARPIL